jgi:hypothetical protein
MSRQATSLRPIFASASINNINSSGLVSCPRRDLTPQGCRQFDRVCLFAAQQTWTSAVLCRGLLYVSQNAEDPFHDTPPRLICYDLREPK